MSLRRRASRPALRLPRARLYHTLRSAYLERAHKLPPATIVFKVKRYDFQESLTEGLDVIQAGPARAAGLLARSPVRQLEINEPLMLSSVTGSALAVAALRLRSLFDRRRVSVVSYAMENANPFSRAPAPGMKSRVKRVLHRVLSVFVWRQLDRIVFATDAARDTYAGALPSLRRRAATTLIPALPAACTCPPSDADPFGVLFVGALVERKGLLLVLEAWPRVRERVTDAHLTIVGKGVLEPRVREFAESDPSITLIIDPERDEIHRQLRRSRVLALPSQPTAIWREQVGLPIVEGLAHGCTVVTTTETGLAAWLSAHGHQVVAPGTDHRVIADALVTALTSGPDKATVMADLPSVDGRLAADAWMFSNAR